MFSYVEPAGPVPPGLIVDRRYQYLILRRLWDLRVGVGAVEDETTLGLCRIALTGLEVGHASGSSLTIENVFNQLHDGFVHDFGGWVPIMEVDRGVEGIAGFPQSKPMYGAEIELPPCGITLPRLEGTEGHGVRIGVLDTGLYLHKLLKGRVDRQSSNLYAPSPAQALYPVAGHATFIAGLIAKHAPGATIISRKVLSNETGHATVWDTARALMSLKADRVDIINVSLGYHTKEGESVSIALQRAVQLLSPGILIVAAAGNHGLGQFLGPPGDTDVDPRLPTWPAALPDVVAVGAAAAPAALPDGPNVQLTEFTPRLPWVTCVAPGFRLLSTYLDNVIVHVGGKDESPVETHFRGLAIWSGTSFAAANATGAIAARTRPGRPGSAAAALTELLDRANPVVRRYTYTG